MMAKKQPDPHDAPITDEEKAAAAALIEYLDTGLGIMLQRTAIGKVPVAIVAGIDMTDRSLIPFAIVMTGQLMDGVVDEPRGLENGVAPPKPKLISLEQHRREKLN